MLELVQLLTLSLGVLLHINLFFKVMLRGGAETDLSVKVADKHDFKVSIVVIANLTLFWHVGFKTVCCCCCCCCCFSVGNSHRSHQ